MPFSISILEFTRETDRISAAKCIMRHVNCTLMQAISMIDNLVEGRQVELTLNNHTSFDSFIEEASLIKMKIECSEVK